MSNIIENPNVEAARVIIADAYIEGGANWLLKLQHLATQAEFYGPMAEAVTEYIAHNDTRFARIDRQQGGHTIFETDKITDALNPEIEAFLRMNEAQRAVFLASRIPGSI